VQDQGFGAIIGGKRDEVGTHRHHREDLETSLGEEEARQRALERGGHRDEDPERSSARPLCQTRFVGWHV
jgi:hypothetical protein